MSERRIEGESAGDRTLSLFGLDVVVKEDFVTFPWRAGIVRAPVAFGIAFALTFLAAAVGGLGDGSLADKLSLIGLVVFNGHNVHAAVGYTPELLVPVAEPVLGLGGIGRLLRGLFVVGVEHDQPLTHLLDVAAGETDAAGHMDFIERSESSDVPSVVYYLIPPVVLAAAGYEFANSHWEAAATDGPLDVARFGMAIAVGYVVVLLAGTVLFTVEMLSGLTGAVIVLPDRFMTLVFGLAYPAVFASLGALVVYVRREGIGGERRSDDPA